MDLFFLTLTMIPRWEPKKLAHPWHREAGFQKSCKYDPPLFGRELAANSNLSRKYGHRHSWLGRRSSGSWIDARQIGRGHPKLYATGVKFSVLLPSNSYHSEKHCQRWHSFAYCSPVEKIVSLRLPFTPVHSICYLDDFDCQEHG